MIAPQILLVEDTGKWSRTLTRPLERLGSVVNVSTFSEATEKVEQFTFDLAVVDLSLPDLSGPEDVPGERGMRLIEQLRKSERNGTCGLIVVTAHWKEHIHKAFAEFRVDAFLDKYDFDEAVYTAAVHRAFLQARTDRAAAEEDARYRLNISFSATHLTGSTLVGPGRRRGNTPDHPTPFEATELAERADAFNWMILQGTPAQWRPEFRRIGLAVYEALMKDRYVLGDLFAARGLAKRFSDLSLQFKGPRIGLGVPFELLRDEGDYLALNYVISRQLMVGGAHISHKTEPFYEFFREQTRHKSPLCVLVIGANSDGRIPAAEAEAVAVAHDVETTIQQLGVPCVVDLLLGKEATYDRVRAALKDGGYHLIHYAGHGRFDDEVAEISGLRLIGKTLTAAELKLLLSDTPTRLIYLSCCLGARTAQQKDRGDFYGVMDALAQADVPLVLGFRWTVADAPAKLMASTFYKHLWLSLSPGRALLQARHSAAMGERGRDDETWASPILLMQND